LNLIRDVEKLPGREIKNIKKDVVVSGEGILL
jgi:hypothetical protein